jgi:protein SCO1
MSKSITGIYGGLAFVRRRFPIDWRIFITAFVLVLTLLASFLLIRYTSYRSVQAKFYGQVLVPANEAYDFHLVDQDGKAFQLSQLHGKLVLFSFGFTHCPNICPTTLSDLAKVYRALPDKARSNVQVMFVSVDPWRDRPEVLKKYVPYFDPSFIGLTGTDDQIAAAAKAYGASYEKIHHPGEDEDVYFMNHSAFTYLISPDGNWKLLYDFDLLSDTEKMVGDVRKVLAGG